jgi:spore coat protein CotH
VIEQARILLIKTEVRCSFGLVYFCLSFFIFFSASQAQSSFYDINVIQKIEIHFGQSNWDYQLDTAKIGSDGYIMADWVKINGTEFDIVGVKYKGNSSFDSTIIKNPLHISLNEYTDQSYEGYTDVKLSNAHSDPSMIREVLAYSILSNYMVCPKSNFAQIYINDQYIGLYTNDESINSEFYSDAFNSSAGTAVKANPQNPGPYSRSNLKYISNDSSDYYNLYEIKSDNGWGELIDACDIVTNFPDKVDSAFKMDRVLWMLAFNNVLVNLDSYSGAFAQNYYLYKDKLNQFNPIVWDLNMAFGGFPFAGMQGGGMGTLTIAGMQNLPIALHFSDSDWPLIKNVMSNTQFKKMYVAHMRTIVNEMFASQVYSQTAQQLQIVVDTAVQSDTNKFFTYDEFLGGLTTNVQFGSYEVPGLTVLMDERVNFLQSSTEFTITAPTISNVAPEIMNPQLNSEVFITAEVTDAEAGSVYLEFRLSNDSNFVKVNMVDDGNHHDATAGDNIFGASFTLNSNFADYYIYAENSLSGSFLPESAEHDYFVLKAEINTAQPGQVVINEFLAINQNDTMNEKGEHEDWIEIYNTTDSELNLYGLYLTDDFLNPIKFAFPENTIIFPHGFIVIWADEDSTTSTFIHCNFKLAQAGEEIMVSDIDGNVIDSLTYGPQTEDISIGRCPDGTGELVILEYSSFNTSNCEAGIEGNSFPLKDIDIWPNPVQSILTIMNNDPQKDVNIEIRDALSRVHYSGILKDKIWIDTEDWPAGIYFLVLNHCVTTRVIKIR